MSKDKKEIYIGIIEKDDEGNFFCGEYLLDYQRVTAGFKPGEKITIRSVIENPSDKSYDKYPKKSKDFFLFNNKK
ncbi:hypothetical protein [Flavobacterium beibuense]|uniref:Uncharacterized protein n=1 Tax=Flavobacterium beibuense TaxID=657326 RepID=A0A444W634_9FLAO|nr:hypothetical protein [Flavobacterium beibuense]RYJ41331.1 hypothetical protein NU09_3074 [Flavobacterium beibuense]